MNFKIPKIIRPITLTDYAPEMVHDDGPDAGKPSAVYVWVNPPALLLTRHGELRAQASRANKQLTTAASDKAALSAVAQELSSVGGGLAPLYAELWSQHADAQTHWTTQDVLDLANNEANPALFGWLTSRTIMAISDHRAGLRKN